MRGTRIILLSAFLIVFGATDLSASTRDSVAFLSLKLVNHHADTLEVLVRDTRANRKWVRFVDRHQNNQKLTAIALAVALGPFGVHRLYLGTTPVVPVVYTLTLGGGLGVLPLADIIAILLAEDLSIYQNNDKIFMWAG
ncbi:MAG: NINE protein [Salibacteraceae bacterium]